MKNFRCRLALTILGMFSVPFMGNAQKSQGVNLFESGQARSTELRPAADAIDSLMRNPAVRLNGIPMLNGETANFDFTRTSQFTPNSRIWLMKENGTSESLPLEPIRTWNGTDPSDPQRTAFLSLNEKNQIRVYISGDKNTSVTVIEPTGMNDTAVSVKTLPPAPTTLCGAEYPPEPSGKLSSSSQDENNHEMGSRAFTDDLYDLELSLDVTKQLYDKLQSGGISVQEYVTNLIGASNTIFRRDLGLMNQVNNLYIWSTPQPFSSNIEPYRTWVNANRNNNSYDLTHQLGYDPGNGGIAYTDVIGSTNTYRVGISHVDGDNTFPSNQSTYYWDTYVLTHEMGHNLGSPHTHCYTPPIDCCALQSGCSGCGSVVPATGTIMSYCHQTMNSGGSINMVFHSRCIDVIRPRIVSSPYLTVRAKQPDIMITGKHKPVIAGSSTAKAVNGTVFGPGVPGGHTSDRTFTIFNNGNLNLNLTGANPVSLAGSSSFSVVSQPTPPTVIPGNSAAFTLRFTPQTTGNHSATVTVQSNDSDTPTFTFAIEGRGTALSPVQTFSTTQGWVIMKGWGAESAISVSEMTGQITDIELVLSPLGSCGNPAISHNNVKDLRMILRSPEGSEIVIFDHPGSGGSSGANICNVRFKDSSALPSFQGISSSSAPHSGEYKPAEPIKNLTGENPNGSWSISVHDDGPESQGVFYRASLALRGEDLSSVADWAIY